MGRYYYFRLAEKKLRCWNVIPKEFQYIAKVSTQKITISFLEELGKEPLHLEAPTAEKCDIWFNALQLECKVNITSTLSVDAKTAELSRCGFVESNPEVSVSRSILDSYIMNDFCEEENLSFEETVDVQTLKNIVEQTVNREKLEREKKKEDDAKFQRELGEKQNKAKRIE